MPASLAVYIGPLLIVLLPVVYLVVKRVQDKRMRRLLITQWGKAEALRRPDSDLSQDIASYWRAAQAAQPQLGAVDDTTWNDLEMDLLLRGIDCSRSIVGSEVLYTVLREQGADEATLAGRDALADAFMRDEALRLRVEMLLSNIGYRAFHGAWRYLYSADYQMPDKPWRFRVLAVLPTLLALLGFVYEPFFIAAILALALNTFVNYRTQAIWEKELVALRHISMVLHAAGKLSKIEDAALAAQTAELRGLLSTLRPIRFWLSLFGSEPVHEWDVLTPYLKIMFMLDMLSFTAIVQGLSRHGEQVRRLYRLVGEMDAVLSIAQLKARSPKLCTPQFTQGLAVQAEGVRHPLVRDAVVNDLHWQRHLLITGSNASGKSTFIKAMAINCVLAQTLHLCFAGRFSMCRAQVLTSMAIRDQLLAGESYFIAEIRSMKRIADAAAGGQRALCFVDEILRGTNTIERIAASSSLLRSFVGTDVLCMAATHDIELTRILADVYDNAHFSETVTEAGVTFDYLLRPGPTRTRNAILLLAQMGFAPDIVALARQQVAHFEQTGLWETDGAPSDQPRLRNPGGTGRIEQE